MLFMREGRPSLPNSVVLAPSYQNGEAATKSHRYLAKSPMVVIAALAEIGRA